MTNPQAAFAFLVVLAIAALILKSRQKDSDASPVPVNLMDWQEWTIGPDMNGVNASVGVPLHPLPHPDGMEFPIPSPDAKAGHIHYLEVRAPSLVGKTGFVLRGRVECEGWVEFAPTKFKPPVPAQITAYLRREGDNWSGVGGYEFFRWFCTSATITGLRPGEFEIRAPFDAEWTPVTGLKNSLTAPQEFSAALAHPGFIGAVLGGGDGYGHGIYATGPARLVLTSCALEGGV